MKTLIISLDKDFPIKTTGNLVVFSYDLIKDLIYEVSNEIARYFESGFLGDKTALLSEFEKDRPTQYNDFISLLKSTLIDALSENNVPETLSLPFPEGYVDWLRYNTNPQFVIIGKAILGKNGIIKINPKEIYEDYFLKGINLAIQSLLKENEDVEFVTISDNENLNIVIFKDIKQSFPNITALQYSDGRIQRMLGLAFYKGEGISQDFLKAVEHFTNAVEKNDPDSLYYLGRLNENGNGVQQDLSEAFHLYSESARLGSMLGKAYLGRAYHKGIGIEIDIPKAIENYQATAEAGIGLAQENLAEIYYEGLEGQPNFEEAFKWYSINAKNEPSIKALHRLGKMLYEGIGTEMNLKQAYQYLKKAAESNFEDSNFLCGQILENKETEIKDEIEPYQYYKQGADKGEYKSATEYAIYLKNKNETSEIESLLKLGVDNGYAKAQYELALYLTETLNENFSETTEQTRDDLLSLAVSQQYQPAIDLNEKSKQQKEIQKQKQLEEEKKLRLTKIDEERERQDKIQRLTKEFILMVQTNYAIEKLYINSNKPSLSDIQTIVNLLVEPCKAGYPYAKAYMGFVQLLIDPTNVFAHSLLKSSITLEDASNIYIDFLGDKDLRKENEEIIRKNFGGINLYFKNQWGIDIDINQHFRSLYDVNFCYDECNIILGYCFLIGLRVKKSVVKALDCFERCKRLDEFTHMPCYDNKISHQNHWKGKDAALFDSYKISDILSFDFISAKTYFKNGVEYWVNPDALNFKIKYVLKQGVDFHNGLRLINALVHELRDLRNVGLLKEDNIESLYYTKIQKWQPAVIKFPSIQVPYLKVYEVDNDFQFIDSNLFYKIETKFEGDVDLIEKLKEQLIKGVASINLTKDNSNKNIIANLLSNTILKEEINGSTISLDGIKENKDNYNIKLLFYNDYVSIKIIVVDKEKEREILEKERLEKEKREKEEKQRLEFEEERRLQIEIQRRKKEDLDKRLKQEKKAMRRRKMLIIPYIIYKIQNRKNK